MAAENDPKLATVDGKKRKRRYLPHNKAVKKKGPSPLSPGVQGFFITCDGGRETQASHEAINVIDSFFDELIHGKDSSANTGAAPEKPLNKKIKFTYSDSSDNEEDENDDESEQENQLERPTGNDANVENKIEVPDPADKTDSTAEVTSGQADGDAEKVGNPVDGKTQETDEPPEKKQCCDTNKIESVYAEKSVDQLLEAELKELGDKSKRRFFKTDTGCNGVIFIQMRRREGDPGPVSIVQKLMESASETKKHMSRFLLRVLPVELSCYASEEEISRAMKPLVEQYFPANSEAPVKFAVQYDARANSGIERMKIIDAVAKSVPGPHKVDLKNPEKTIIVQIVKTVCLIGVVEKYKELAKFNLRQLTSSKP
ncbi:unnamed protein product [Amaranthus hypochondriacus]